MRAIYDFESLLVGAAHGDGASAAALWHKHAPAIRSAIRRRLSLALRARYDSEDISQSVFADVWRALPRFESRGERAFRRWLVIKAENKVRDKARSFLHGRPSPPERPATSTLEVASPGASPEGALIRREQARWIEVARRTLEDGAQWIFHLRAEGGLTFAEIARLAGLPSPEAARKRYARALVQLRDQLPGVGCGRSSP